MPISSRRSSGALTTSIVHLRIWAGRRISIQEGIRLIHAGLMDILKKGGLEGDRGSRIGSSIPLITRRSVRSKAISKKDTSRR